MQKDVTIIKASEKHAEEACQVLIRSIKEVCVADHNNDPKVLQEWLSNKTDDDVKKWINDNNNYSIVAINKQGKVIGFSMISMNGEILLNYLLPEYLFKGIGKMMLNNLELFAKKSGLNKIMTMSTKTALEFYKKHGFIEDTTNTNSCIPLVKKIA